MAKKRTSKQSDDSKLFAFLATFLSIVGFIIAMLVKKDNKYVMHYAKQSLVVFIVYLVAFVVVVIPFIGWLAAPILYVVAFLLWIFSWIYALSGEMKEVPLIGKYARKIKL